MENGGIDSLEDLRKHEGKTHGKGARYHREDYGRQA